MSSSNIHTDQELLLLIAEGDPLAFSLWYHRTNATLFSAVMLYTRDRDMAAELVQAIYVRLWERRAALKEVKNGRNYLFVLARNMVFDHFSKLAAEDRCMSIIQHQTIDRHQDVLAYLEEKECRHILRQSIDLLPSRQREVYLLASEKEMSYEEIADSIRVSRFTVKRHLELARRFVRQYVQHHLHEQALIPLIFLLSASLLSHP